MRASEYNVKVSRSGKERKKVNNRRRAGKKVKKKVASYVISTRKTTRCTRTWRVPKMGEYFQKTSTPYWRCLRLFLGPNWGHGVSAPIYSDFLFAVKPGALKSCWPQNQMIFTTSKLSASLFHCKFEWIAFPPVLSSGLPVNHFDQFLSPKTFFFHYMSLFRELCHFLSLFWRYFCDKLIRCDIVFARTNYPQIWSLIRGPPSHKRAL